MKKKIISILVILVCTIFMVSAVGATSTLALGVQVDEVGPNFQIRYLGGTGGFVGEKGELAPSEEDVSITAYGDRAYVVYYAGNLSASKNVTISLSATSFLNQADSDLPSASVNLIDRSHNFQTSSGTTPAALTVTGVRLPAGYTQKYTELKNSEFYVTWLGDASLPAGNYKSTITVNITVA